MKKIVSVLIVLSVFVSSAFIFSYKTASASSIDAACDWAVAVANDNSHGYSQSKRYGNPDYDCSSLVCGAFAQAGFGVDAQGNTRTMVADFQNHGFSYITNIDLSSSAQLIRGDILWRSGHTELYVGNNKICGAHMDYDGKDGDSNGKEINVQNYYYKSYSGTVWQGILRYNGKPIEYDTVAEGNYSIVNAGSGKYLNAFANPGTAKKNTDIRACNGDGTPEQKFRIQSAGENKYYIRSLSNDNQFCVNASSGSTVNNGANVHLWEFNDVASKLWYFKLENGAYVIYNVMNPSLVLTAANYDHRANVCVSTYTGSDLQRWQLNSINPHTHNFSSSVTKNPTCDDTGIRTFVCDCGASYNEAIPMTAHTVTVVSGKNATCTESGLTDGTKCAVCGIVLQANQEIPALGHDWESEFTVDREATESESGEKSRHCTRCDARKDVTEIPVNNITPPKPDIQYGDIDGNGEIDIKDVVLLRMYLVEINKDESSIPSSFHSDEADVDSDGDITIKDLELLRSYLEQMSIETGESPVQLGPKTEKGE
ncbi:MAG: RICIN domain-containing protein [Clostridia bacterium]|nr:RICIN domain-containing protein [Clostridia bacterium]